MSNIQARDTLARIEDYQVETVPDADIIVNANEMNWDLTPELRLELNSRLAEHLFNRYPSMHGEDLCAAIAAKLGFDPELVAIGNGSSELLAEYAKRKGSCVIIKGLRAGSDFEKEFQMALINHNINPDLDTMFLTAEHQYMYLSSSTVKELGRYDVDLSQFLPQEIIPDFQERIKLISQGGK